MTLEKLLQSTVNLLMSPDFWRRPTWEQRLLSDRFIVAQTTILHETDFMSKSQETNSGMVAVIS